jgi:hypothetical protein
MQTRWNRNIGAVAGTLLVILVSRATSAPAQIPSFTQINPALNCSAGAGGCTIRKYGLSAPESYTNGEPNAYDPSAKNHNSFGQGSYFYTRSFPVPGAKHCGAERAFVPLFGQVYLREESDCIPPTLAPGQCTQCPAGGCTNGAACNSFTDCPGGLCNNVDAGCPVEIPTDQFIAGEEIVYMNPFISVSPTPFGPIWVSVAANGGLATDGIGLYEPDKRPGLGRRYRNPAGPGTVLHWNDLANGGGNAGNGVNYSTLCCNDAAGGLLCTGQLFQVYPTLTPLPERSTNGRREANWIFPDDIVTTPQVEGRFFLDQTLSIPNQNFGVCANNRSIGCSRPGALSVAQCTGAGAPHFCCTGVGAGNCGTECAAVGGACDLREMGWRFNRQLDSLADGSPNLDHCNTAPFVFRGTLNQNCSILKLYNECLALDPPETCVVPAGRQVGRCSVTTDLACSPGPSPLPLTANGNTRWGDPGPDCGVINYGVIPRPDVNCDGIEDPTIDTTVPRDGIPDVIGDACPYYTETNSIKNTDGAKRADECKCGDSNRDGRVSVADIVDINSKIFNPPGAGTPAQGNADLAAPTSDTNEDGLVTVSDIVAVNIDIFNPLETSRCGRSPVIGE